MKIMKPLIKLLLLFWVTGLTTNTFAQVKNLPEGISFVDSIEGIREYRLDNGLQVLLIPDSSRQNIMVNIIYRVGSRHESYGETGMAHLLEHLLFRGTPKHPDIPAELTARGASPNGTTWWDRTNYYETFVATDENLDWALDLEADRMINSFVSKKDLEQEFSVVRNEMESGENNPGVVLNDKVMAAAYQWHNYGKTTIGARSDVEKVKIENLQAFYKKYYQPDNATLVLGGKFDESKTLELISKKFGVIPRPARVLENTWTVEPAQDGERQVIIRRVGDIQLLIAGYHVPPASHPDFAAFRVLTPIMTDTTTGKLQKALVETKKVTNVSANVYQNKEPTYNIFTAQLAKDANIEDARETMLKSIESWADQIPSEVEVERTKTGFLKGIELNTNNAESMAMSMTGWVASGDWRLYFLYRDRIKKVTPADVQRVAKTYLIPSNRTVGMFIPTQNPVRAQVPRVEDEQIIAMTKDIVRGKEISEGEVFDPTPSNILKRTKMGQIGGLKTAFLSKENRGDTVILRIQLRFGDERSLMNRVDAGNFSGRILSRGTRTKDRQQLRDAMDKLKSNISVFGGATGVQVSIETTREKLPDAIRLAAEIAKEPGFPEKEFEQMKIDTLTSLEARRSEPNRIIQREQNKLFNSKFPVGHPNYPRSLDEEIASVKAITLDDVKKFYQDFYGANGEVAVIGEFDEKEILNLLDQQFGRWKSPTPYKRISIPFNDVAPVNKSFETPDKANAVFVARLNIKMRDDDPDYAAFQLGNFILGGGFLNSRLATRIRAKEGISYGVGSDFSTNAFDESGSFFASAIYAPENVTRLEAAFKEELTKAITTGFTDDEVNQAKIGLLLDRQRSRGNDSGIAMALVNQLNSSRTFAWDDALDKRFQALTTKQVNDAMKKYLNIEKISIFKAGDFSKAKAASVVK